MSRNKLPLAFLFLAVFASGLILAATPPGALKLQGFLSDRSGGSPVPANGTYSMTFEVYDAAVDGIQLGVVGPLSVSVADGVYEVELPLSPVSFEDTDRYLQITVNGELLDPRVKIVSVPYAYFSGRAEAADAADIASAVVEGSVVAASIAPGAVDTAAIADAAVTGNKIGIICSVDDVLVYDGADWVCSSRPICPHGSYISCYNGPPETAGVGLCVEGTSECNIQGTGFGPCTGEVLPDPERCNGLDDDCDGAVDEDGVCVGCSNGVLDGDETDVDCGGVCTGCENGLTCAVDDDCISSYCDPGTYICAAKPCSVGSECASGNCADGYCCDTSCSGLCEACNRSGNEGTCDYVPAFTDPDNECAGSLVCNGAGSCGGSDGDPCSLPSECVSGNCIDGFCCDTLCSGLCEACNISGSLGSCRWVPSGSDPDGECSPTMVCDGVGGCALENGQLCASPPDCASGWCVDGFCCDSSCGDSCDACDMAGSEGTCTVTPDGLQGSPSCSPYVCDGATSSCPVSCTTSADCEAGYGCNGSNQCVATLPNGSSCALPGECQSGYCVDGYCCDSSCAGSCEACDVDIVGICSLVPDGLQGSPSCSPYVCDGTSSSCPSSCATSADCEAGYGCNGSNQCVILAACSSVQNGERRCNGNLVEECDGNYWYLAQDCSDTGHVCVEPVPGNAYCE